MKLNEDKCHFIISGYKHEIMFANIGESRIWEKGQQKLLGVTIDNNLKFKEHILEQCKKTGKKLSASGIVCHILSLERRRLLMKAFIESQFGYCPLVWMFCDRQENNRINHLHERALKIVYDEYESTFENLLELDGNIRLLSIELYGVMRNLSNQVMSELFNLRNINYDFRSQTDFELGPTYTTAYGLRSLKYFAPKIWNIVPTEIRNSDSPSEFTTKIKSWKPVTCPVTCPYFCRSSRIYRPMKVSYSMCIHILSLILTISLLRKQPLRGVSLK